MVLGTSCHTAWPDTSWVCGNEPQECLGTLGGAEGSQKGSCDAAKGCSGYRTRGPHFRVAFPLVEPSCLSGPPASEKLLVTLCHSPPSTQGTSSNLVLHLFF